jgi:hypothetical protein
MWYFRERNRHFHQSSVGVDSSSRQRPFRSFRLRDLSKGHPLLHIIHLLIILCGSQCRVGPPKSCLIIFPKSFWFLIVKLFQNLLGEDWRAHAQWLKGVTADQRDNETVGRSRSWKGCDCLLFTKGMRSLSRTNPGFLEMLKLTRAPTLSIHLRKIQTFRGPWLAGSSLIEQSSSFTIAANQRC